MHGDDGDDRFSGTRCIDTINGGAGNDQALPPAAGSPAMVSIETILGNDTALMSAATAARQVWLNQFLAVTDNTDDFIDRDEIISIVNTQAV
jgi:hypothetical protein